MKSVNNQVPIPSHFKKEQFTIGAFDNFDSADRSSATGKMSTHDTVSVLFQIKPDAVQKKPPLSIIKVDEAKFSDLERLPCQYLRSFKRGIKSLELPSSFSVDDKILSLQDVQKDLTNTEFLINIVRNSSNIHIETLPTWAGCHSLIYKSQVPLMHVGFIPFIPHPVTEIESVYTAMKNFQSVLDQIEQTSLPLVCDEGVYRLVIEIYLKNPEEFKNLIPMLGNFHMMKAFQHCIGKLLKGSGIEDALIETNAFGVNTVESVLNGTHYVRAMRGLNIISEIIFKMQWEAFLVRNNGNNFQEIFDQVNDLSSSLKIFDSEASKTKFYSCLENINNPQNEFERFCKAANESSEMCHYWSSVQRNIQILKESISSDRTGNWTGHLISVQKMLPTFAECDGINYFRYASFYLEQMRRLPIDHPEVHSEFLAGKFVVRTKSGNFSAVAPDMKLEQTIQRAKKNHGGIIGQTKQVGYVTEWEIIYHEILSISNMFRTLTSVNTVKGDNYLQHELSGNYLNVFNDQVKRTYDFVNMRGNPFNDCKLIKLHNFVSGVLIMDQVAERFIKFELNSESRYQMFRKAIFLDKSRKLSDTISKSKFPTLLPVTLDSKKKKTEKQIDSKFLSKEISEAQKHIDIARGRNFTLKEILRFDLINDNSLFKNDFTSKTNKAELVTELESRLERATTFSKDSFHKTALIIDFMSLMRSQTTHALNDIEDILKQSWNSAYNSCSFDEIHLVYDSYIDSSLKECERTRRSLTEHVDCFNLNLNTKLPVQMEKFWSSIENKKQLQQLSRNYFKEAALSHGKEIILSGYIDSEFLVHDCVRINSNFEKTVDELRLDLEEADLRLIPHVQHAIQKGCKRVVMLSNDADVVALDIHYMGHFSSIGLTEFWIRYGTGKKSRFIPIHELVISLGQNLSSVVLKAHILTGCDVTSKIGTKAASLKSNPELYLKEFGESELLDPERSRRAEAYLVQVWALRSKPKESDFDSLRYSMYVSKKSTIQDLPPTSSSINGHLERCHFVIRQTISLLQNNFHGNPRHYGWEELSGVLIPQKRLLPLPKFFIVRCKCKKKCSNDCSCASENVDCTEFCICSTNCENSS